MTNSLDIKPAIIFHVVVASLDTGLAVLFGVGVYSLFSGDPLAIADIVGAVMVLPLWLFTAALARHVFLLARRPQLRISPDGIFLRYYKSGFRSFLFPHFRLEERMIAWADFRGCRTESVLLHLVVPIHKKLIIESTGPRIEFGWMTFRPGVEKIQKELLDYLQLTVQKPARESARVAEFLGLLFRQPKTFPGPRIRRFEVVAAVAAAALCGLMLYLQFNKQDPNLKGAVYAMVGTAVAVSVVGFPLQLRIMSAQRFIQLSVSGIAVGPEERSARVIAWSDILLVRVHDGSVSKPGTRLELRLANGDTFFIRDFREAAQLAAVIDPPPERVQAAWPLIAKGATAENAARAVGLSVL
ncbi:MAG TPA: hypothetical protein VNW23_04015 [Opitutaceae bacterium]|jgi:hypothetical protein|nr:hypothetical protein [Opitutaceae bacterium]